MNDSQVAHDDEHAGEVLTPGTSMHDPIVQLRKITRQKITHLLRVYPAISATAIQTGIGTSQSPKLWRPLLQEMINEGIVKETKVNVVSPHERHQVHAVYHLASFDYEGYRHNLAMQDKAERQAKLDAKQAPQAPQTPSTLEQNNTQTV